MARWGELEGDGEKEAKYKHVLWLDVDSLAESVALVFAVLVLWAVLVGAEFDIHGVFSLLCVRVGGLVRPHWLLVLLVCVTITPVNLPGETFVLDPTVAVVANEGSVGTVLLVGFNDGCLGINGRLATWAWLVACVGDVVELNNLGVERCGQCARNQGKQARANR